MKKLSTGLLFVVLIIITCTIFYPICAMKPGFGKKNSKQESTSWQHAQYFADSIMERVVGQLPLLGEPAQKKYTYHRHGFPLYLGSAVTVANKKRFSDENNNAFNDTDNVLRLIEGVKGTVNNNIECLYGAVRERDYVYPLIINKKGEVAEVRKAAKNMQNQQLYFTFACNTILYKYNTHDAIAVRNGAGHKLVTKGTPGNRKPVIYNDEIFFETDADNYTNEQGEYVGNKKTIKPDNLPTLDSKYYPNTAVALVLAGTPVTALGTGWVASRVLKWCCNNIFGKKQIDKSESDKQESVSSNTTATDANNTETNKQELTQQPEQKAHQNFEQEPKKETQKSGLSMEKKDSSEHEKNVNQL